MALVRSGTKAGSAGPEAPAPLDGAELRCALDAPDAALRARAAIALAGVPGTEALLAARLVIEEHAGAREAILLALARMRSAAAARCLAELLACADAALRNGVLDSLAAMPEQAAGLIEDLLAHADPDVRICAVLLLADLDHPKVQPWLLRLLTEQDDPNLCAAAAEVLAEVGDATAVPVLRVVADRFAREPFVVFAARMAIARIAGAGAPT
jgi:HEAT repeat protein